MVATDPPIQKAKGRAEVSREEALEFHRRAHGKIQIASKVPMRNQRDLSLAYTPGVAEPCREIAQDMLKVYEYTNKGNQVAIVTDGSAVLGLGDLGPRAALPVMEGKAILFKKFAGIDGIPICLDTKDPDRLVEAVKLLQPTFGGINLEDISAPRCFAIEERLRKEMTIPVFHDDQHGTAIITLAGLLNACKVVDKPLEDLHVVVNGAGAAGIAIAKLLMHEGVRDVILCDSKGTIHSGRTEGMNKWKTEMAEVTNKGNLAGGLKEAVVDRDVFIGVSVADVMDSSMVRAMADDPIVFAQANPVPEIMPEVALDAGAKVYASGRSDFPNQINNVMGFPGVFRGSLDVMATDITVGMQVAAAKALASLVSPDELGPEYIVPSPLDPRVVPTVAIAVAQAAGDDGVSRRPLDRDRIIEMITFGK
ncbi:MAG: NAD-dependent malic enzyme [Euryarchaeota archaeon]|nr:NAD-dependent malic enzyme [Euryarchaeota archaeon]